MAQLLSNLPIGAKVKFGKHSVNGETAQQIIWLIVARNHTGYPSNSVTMLTERIIDLRALDAAEPNSNDSGRWDAGNNLYSISNLDQWLNSDAISWYTQSHPADQEPISPYVTDGTPYVDRPGFLSNFTPTERDAILSTSITVAAPINTTENLTRRVFLPSITEVGRELPIKDGVAWGYFLKRKPSFLIILPLW